MTKVAFVTSVTTAKWTDRGKRGSIRSLLQDGVGNPLAQVVDEANRFVVKLLCVTVDGLVTPSRVS